MGFDYRNTCPDIDQSISDLKQGIEDILNDRLKEVCPLIDETYFKMALDEDADSIYDLIEGSVEKIRDTNSDMRKVADAQIDELENEILELRDV